MSDEVAPIPRVLHHRITKQQPARVTESPGQTFHVCFIIGSIDNSRRNLMDTALKCETEKSARSPRNAGNSRSLEYLTNYRELFSFLITLIIPIILLILLAIER